MVCRSQKVLQHRSQICRILIACIWSAPCTFRVNPCWSWEHLERGNPHALLQFVVDFNDDRPITPFPSIKQPVTIDISSWAFTEHLDWLQGTVLPVFTGDIMIFVDPKCFFSPRAGGKNRQVQVSARCMVVAPWSSQHLGHWHIIRLLCESISHMSCIVCVYHFYEWSWFMIVRFKLINPDCWYFFCYYDHLLNIIIYWIILVSNIIMYHSNYHHYFFFWFQSPRIGVLERCWRLVGKVARYGFLNLFLLPAAVLCHLHFR